jgi:hypothetical protein
MPRHPPFALRNLTTYMSILVRTPPPKRWRPMIYIDHQDSSRSSNLRCSRPLCSSQLTVGTVDFRALRQPAGPREETPKGAVWSLRTQQRACARPLSPRGSELPRQLYFAGLDHSSANVNVPPLSFHRSTCATVVALRRLCRRDAP